MNTGRMDHPDQNHQRCSIRLAGYDYAQPGAYFVTMVTQGRDCLLGEIVDGTMQENAAGFVAQNEWKRLAERFPTVHVDGFVVMPNHIHGIILLDEVEVGQDGVDGLERVRARQSGSGALGDLFSASPLQVGGVKGPLLGVVIGAYKSTTARFINGLRRTPGAPVWQRNYYEHIIRSEAEMGRIQKYILENPIAWDEDDENPD